MKTMTLTLVAALAIASLIAATYATKIGTVSVQAKNLEQRVTDANCWDADGSIEGSDYCMSVAYPNVDEDFMGE